MRNINVHLNSPSMSPSVGDVIRVTGFILTGLLATVGKAHATTYNDGGTHTISGPDLDVVILNGTTVNIIAGASVMTFTPFLDPRGMLDFLESGILTRRIQDHGQEAFYRGADCLRVAAT